MCMYEVKSSLKQLPEDIKNKTIWNEIFAEMEVFNKIGIFKSYQWNDQQLIKEIEKF